MKTVSDEENTKKGHEKRIFENHVNRTIIIELIRATEMLVRSQTLIVWGFPRLQNY